MFRGVYTLIKQSDFDALSHIIMYFPTGNFYSRIDTSLYISSFLPYIYSYVA